MEKKTNGLEIKTPALDIRSGYQPSSGKPKPKPKNIRLPKGTGAVKPKKEK